MSEESRRNLALFWSVLDEILIAMIFLLIGFEMLGLKNPERAVLLSMLLSIPLSMLVLAVSIAATAFRINWNNRNRWPAVAVLSWGGVRGGISIALALSIGQAEWKLVLLAICSAVVIFTILVQALSLKSLVASLDLKNEKRGSG